MDKVVNIKSSNVLYIFTPPMSGVFNNQKMTTGDIKNCILQGAYVEEVLSDGRTIRLDLTNFDKVNELPKIELKEEKKEIKVEEKKVELPKKLEQKVEVNNVESDTEIEAPVKESTDTQPLVEDSTIINSETTTEDQPSEVESLKESIVEEKPVKQSNNYDNRNKNYKKR